MKKNLSSYFLLIVLLMLSSFQSDKPAYRFFSMKGKNLEYAQVLKQAKEADVIFFGELHDNPICHWLQIELLKDLYKESSSTLIAGAEMFETDNQLILDEYLQGVIPTSNFEKEMRLWNNYSTDYKPLIEFSKEKKIPFIATNIPRRYAAMVSKNGPLALDSLSDAAKKLLFPLPLSVPYELPSYQNMLGMMGHSGSSEKGKNFIAAQASKDACMAYRISESMSEKSQFLHFNGAYHSDNHEGIIYYLKLYKPTVKVFVISSVLQESLDSLEKEYENKGDVILAVPEQMCRTY